jgi:hypothetical protein
MKELRITHVTKSTEDCHGRCEHVESMEGQRMQEILFNYEPAGKKRSRTITKQIEKQLLIR